MCDEYCEGCNELSDDCLCDCCVECDKLYNDCTCDDNDDYCEKCDRPHSHCYCCDDCKNQILHCTCDDDDDYCEECGESYEDCDCEDCCGQSGCWCDPNICDECGGLNCIHNKEGVTPPLNAFARAKWLKAQGEL